ncbi:MAG TPA: hypothetical protein VK661_12360 [Planctomycetota bacterium]|nr:hypothetical protein [Planctomycetota bacterium]
MYFPRLFAALIIVASTGAAAEAQDIVRLKNGKILSGVIAFEGDSKAGFVLRRWDTGGEIFVRWNQIPDAEAYRIRTRIASPSEAVGGQDLIDAIRIVTNQQRELVGIILSEKDGNISIKTRDGVQQTHKSAEVHREPVRVKESDVYTPEEMIDRRAKGVGDADFAKLVELGHFASSIRVYARAQEFFKRAQGVAPAERVEEMKGLVNAMGVRIIEDNAEKALAAARKMAAEYQFDGAIAAAQKFLTEFNETSVAKANQNIVSEIENRKKEYFKDRDKVLAADVPDHWRTVRATLISKYTSSKYTLQLAREAIAKLDEEIVAEVAKKLNATADEVGRHWDARTEKKYRTVSMKDGTWIHRGGQDGGLDYTGDGSDDLEDFKRRFEGGQDPKKKPPPLGQKLETQIEWWQNASNSMRREWLECLYADTSSKVKKEKEDVVEKNCGPCKGEGKIKQTRGGKPIEYICHECHGCKKVLTIKYW